MISINNLIFLFSMARFNPSILGEATGNAGRANFYRWRGKTYVRGRMGERGNDNATESQLLVQRRFSLLSSFLRPFSNVLKLGFVKVPEGKTYNNVAFSANYDNIISSDAGLSLNYPNMSFSDGLEEFKVTALFNGSSLDLEWAEVDSDSPFYKVGRIYVAVFNSNNGKTLTSSADTTALEASVSLVDIMGDSSPLPIYAYLFASTGSVSSYTQVAKSI